MSIANARRTVSKLRQERHGAVHAMPDMPLLTELPDGEIPENSDPAKPREVHIYITHQ
jgi:hypothetical protein